MAVVNLGLAFALVAAHHCSESGYALHGEMAAISFAVAVATALGLQALIWAASRVAGLAGAPASGVAASAAHAVVLLVLAFYYFEGVRDFGSELPARLGSATAAGLALTSVLVAVTWLVHRLPRLAVARFLSAYLVAALAVVVIQGSLPARAPEAPAAGPGPTGDPLPNVYYIVLDGHAGFPAFPKQVEGAIALRDRIHRDYVGRGFEVYREAYSNFYWTLRSLYSLLDNRIHDRPPRIGHEKFELPPNRLFDDVIARGYHPVVFYNDYFDVCRAARAHDPACRLHRVHADSYGLPRGVRVPLLLAGLANRLVSSDWLTQKRRFYGVANAVAAIDELVAEIPKRPKNTFFFAHILAPHEPHVLDGRCRIRESDVYDRRFVDYYRATTRAEAKRRWRAYLDQLACVHDRVGRFLDALEAAGLYEESTIIIHGDHGPRIGLAEQWGPPLGDRQVGRRTFLDFYATLFAVKRGGYPLEPLPEAALHAWRPISHLLAGLMGWPRAEAVQWVYRGSILRPVRPPFL